MAIKKLFTLSAEDKARLSDIAQQLVGVPYLYGAKVSAKIPPYQVVAAKLRIDCSGLVRYIYGQIGRNVPDGSNNQFDASLSLFDAPLEIGDLVFKTANGTQTINHVGLIASADPLMVVEAEGWVGAVVLTPFARFSNPRPRASQYAGARRFVEK